MKLRSRAIVLAGVVALGPPVFAGAAHVAASAADAPALRVKRLTVDVHVKPDGTAVQTSHLEILATNAAAAMRVGQMRTAYDSAIQTLDVTKAYTRKKDGQRIPVEASAIYDQLAPGAAQLPLFSDQHLKTIVFPQFEAGDTAVYTLRMTAKKPYFPGAYWYGDTYPTTGAFDDVRETVTAPASLHLKAESYGVSVHRREQDGKVVYTWHYVAPHPQKPKTEVVAQLAVTPHVFISSFPDYAALGRAYAEAAAPKMKVTPRIQALADKLTKHALGEYQKAKALYEWVSTHIRYVAVELGQGALVPHDARTVLNNGYGDCKDHVVLLGALLSAENIASDAVLINSSNDYTLTKVPTFVGLDHVVTYVPDLDMYLDSTAVVAPFGALPFQEYGKPIVYASTEHAERGSMPVLKDDRSFAFMATNMTLHANGTLAGVTVTTAAGPYSILLRLAGLGVQRLGPKTAATRLMRSLGYGSDATGTLDIAPPTKPGISYKTTGRFFSYGWQDRLDGSRKFVMPGGMRLLGILGNGMMGNFGADQLAPDAERPCYSVKTVEMQSLRAPVDVKFAHVPKDTHVETKYLSFDAVWTLVGNQLSVRRTFTSHIGRALCTPKIRKANASALQRIEDSYDTQLSFKKVDSYAPKAPAVKVPRVTLPKVAVPQPN